MGGRIDSAPWLKAATQVLVEDVASPELNDESYHHLSKVLRLRQGEVVCASDGAGEWALCRFDGGRRLVGGEESGSVPVADPHLTVGIALVKASKPELVVQKLTELGIDRIVLFEARNSVVRWDATKAERQIQRLRKIAVEACAQSRRLHLPSVEFAALADLVGGGRAGDAEDLGGYARGDSDGDGHGRGAVLADAGGRPMRRSDTVVLIGPEGGWDPTESELGERVTLGTTILRAETAAIAAAAQMVSLRAGLLTESN